MGQYKDKNWSGILGTVLSIAGLVLLIFLLETCYGDSSSDDLSEPDWLELDGYGG